MARDNDRTSKAEKKAYEYLRQAEKTGKKKLGLLPPSSTSLEDRAELFQSAGNQFKIASNYLRAGECLLQAAEAFAKAKSSAQSNQMYAKAATCFKQAGNAGQAAKCLERAVDAALDAGQFFKAANILKDIGVSYRDAGDFDNALENFERAAEYFASEGSETNANQWRLEAADIRAMNKDYIVAIDTYEEVARSATGNNLTKWSAKDYLLRALITALAMPDVELARQNLSIYADIDHTLPGSREYKFIEKLIEAFESTSADDWAQACADYDSIARLNRWKTTMLLRGRDHIEGAGEEGEDVLGEQAEAADIEAEAAAAAAEEEEDDEVL
ncbi:NSF attachment protein [Carpediemonas membranifera]|uniref:NSF attachment protein n=1 Tax=Carpediemonas membranifera TaxID=201153 RepID=A0A8J6BZQ7_9EUKA|nr:NSF attachment protein [Carpediemonas membranifera]|eukprot:KAG9395766.1 NSF attachment protein [Carpediemonas membranifera]